MAIQTTQEQATKMGRSNNDDDEPKIVVTKITPQLVTLWNKELDRLHKMLLDPNSDDKNKEWAKDQISKLHKMVFG